MLLKSIEIIGFKSFPDRIELIFPKGITCVVGPNGSGKSNISDAIRWVMGEQSIKTLRGGKMEDVIFSGTQKRKPLGYCEVTLLVGNEDRALPLDFDEIMITRRLFRSGESEYYINKSACRLKDIHELFMDTGLGKDGYSVIGQGKIDSIISGKPSERRAFFEEACGISKYHHRKDEAERKLSGTNDNILRVNDIILELETQLEPLKLQAEKAKKYLVIRDELKELEVNVWLDQYEKLKGSKGKVEEDYKHSAKCLLTNKEQLSKLDTDIEQFNKKSRELQEENDRLKQECYNFEYNIKTFENQIEISKNNILHSKENKKRIQQEKKDLLQRITEFEKNQQDFLEKVQEYGQKKQGLEEEERALTLRWEEILSKISSHHAKTDGLRLEYAQKNNELLTVKGKKAAVESLLVGLKERREGIKRQEEEKSLRLKNLEDEIQNNHSALTVTQQEEEQIRESINKEAKLEEIRASELKTCESNQTALENEGQRLKSRIELLTEMENNFSGYPKAVKEVMQAKLQGVTLYGTVGGLIKTKPQYAAAIDSALAASVNHVVCAKEDDAKAAIEFLKRQKAGRVTFLPVSSVNPQNRLSQDLSKEPGYIGNGVDLINCDSRFQGVAESLLNRTAVFDTLDHAIAVMRKFKQSFRTVTLTGEILHPGGSITGGEFKNSLGAMKRNAEIEELKQNLEQILVKEKSIKETVIQLSAQLKELRESLRERQQLMEELNGKKIQLLSALKYKTEQAEALKADLLEFSKELSELLTKEEKGGVEISSFEDIIKREEEVLSRFEEEISERSGSLLAVNQEKDELSESLSALKLRIADLSKDLSYEEDKISAIEGEKSNALLEIEKRDAQIEEIDDTILDTEDEIVFRQEQITGLRETILQYEKNMEVNRKDAADSIKSYEESTALSKTLREEYMLLTEETSRLEMQVQKIETDTEQIINNLWEAYELSLTKAEELKKDIGSIAAASKKIGELKMKIKGLGNINIDAIEECKAVSERYEFLTAQRDDLITAKDNLEKIISDMLKLMKEIFIQQFTLIAQSFHETYVELFGGGRAQLILTDPDNVLESGIEIEVQPPGKKLTTISLLSGGEKAFTAIALLFAILKIKPTPFCLFDEIEAALDDVNVYRYADYLSRFKEHTQFIVITHRRGSMEAADTLYGVTMQERGVSKLLSLNIDEIEEEGLVK